jgi:hypothetical protein
LRIVINDDSARKADPHQDAAVGATRWSVGGYKPPLLEA